MDMISLKENVSILPQIPPVLPIWDVPHGIGKKENVLLAQIDGLSMNKIFVCLFLTNVLQVIKLDFVLHVIKDKILKKESVSILCQMMLNQLI